MCRSPFAERAISKMLDPLGASVMATSAGLSPMTGSGISGDTAELLVALGVPADRHRARALRHEEIIGADLILTATRAHRARVVAMHPPAVARTFTIRQFGQVMGRANVTGLPAGHPDERLSAAVGFVRRNLAVASNIGSDSDVVDPYGKRRAVHVRAAGQMLPTLNDLAVIIGGSPLSIPAEFGLTEFGSERHPWWKKRRSDS